jgi:hypothetical protein
MYGEVPVAYEQDTTLLSQFEKRGGEEDVNSRGLFFTMQVRTGGQFGQTSFDNGALGRGSASQYLRSVCTPVDFVLGVELSKKVEISTNSNKKSIVNVDAREVANSLKQIRTSLDILANGAGSGILGTATTISGTTWTLPATGPSTAWFYVGQPVELYTANMVTKRTGVAIIQTIDPVAHQLTVDALPTSGVSGDVIAIRGLTAGAGLTQSLFGLDYHINSANTGTWQSVNRANYPEVRAEEYAAGGAMIALPFGRILINKIAKNLGVDFATGSGLRWYGPLDQRANIEELAQMVMRVDKQPSADQKFDGAFSIGSFVGLPANDWSIHCDPTKMYAVKFKNFVRAVSAPIQLYKVTGGTETRFPVYSIDGGIQATTLYYYMCSMQIGNILPRASGVISGLAPESGLAG